MLKAFIVTVLLIQAVVSETDWTDESYQMVADHLEAKRFDTAFELMINIPNANDDDYWHKMPGIILNEFQTDADKLYRYAIILVSQTKRGYNDDQMIHNFIAQLLRLDCVLQIKLIIQKMVKTIENPVKIQQILLPYSGFKEQNNIILRWYFAQALVRDRRSDRRDHDQKKDKYLKHQYSLVTAPQHAHREHDFVWKSCIEYSRLFWDQSPDVRYSWYDETVKRIHAQYHEHFTDIDRFEFYSAKLEWIHPMVDDEDAFKYIFDKLIGGFPLDDAATVQKLNMTEIMYVGNIISINKAGYTAVIEMIGDHKDLKEFEVQFVGNTRDRVGGLREGDTIAFAMQNLKDVGFFNWNYFIVPDFRLEGGNDMDY